MLNLILRIRKKILMNIIFNFCHIPPIYYTEPFIILNMSLKVLSHPGHGISKYSQLHFILSVKIKRQSKSYFFTLLSIVAS